MLPVSQSTIDANFLAFSNAFSCRTHGFSAVPLCENPLLNKPIFLNLNEMIYP